MSWTSSTTQPGSTQRQHRNDIDGLRAVAILAVLAFHTHAPGFSGGFVGVDVFFVISGYLICSIIVREIDQGSFSIARFYERRCKRILPALFGVLLFCTLAAVLLLSPVEATHLGKGIMATALSVSNVQFYLRGSYFDRGGLLNPLLMTWSLAVEEQFYIVFPLLMLLLYKRNKKHLFRALTALCCLSLLLSIYTEFTHPEFNFYMPFTRAWELGAGTLFAVWQAQGASSGKISQRLQDILGPLGLLMMAACIVFYSPATRFPGYEAILPVLGTVFLLAAPSGFTGEILGCKPLVGIGLISYSLYIWHWPLLSFAAIVSPAPISALARATLMLLAGVMATLSYFFIETPFRTVRYPNRTRVLAAYASLIAVVFSVGFVLARTSGLPQRAPALAKIENSLQLQRVHNCINAADRGPILSNLCMPPPTSAPAIALLGDSHAEAIAPSLRRNVAAAGGRLVVLDSFSCPPLQGFTRTIADAPEFGPACARFNTQVLHLLRQRNDIKTVILTGAWAMVKEDKFTPVGYRGNASQLSVQQSGNNLVLGLASEIHALEGQGKNVVLIDDVPSLSFTPIDQVRASALPVRRLIGGICAGHMFPRRSSGTIPRSETVTPEAEAVRSALRNLAESDPRLKLVDTKDVFCTASNCAYSDGTNLFYTDNNHISQFGAAKILSAAHLTQSLGLEMSRMQSNSAPDK